MTAFDVLYKTDQNTYFISSLNILYIYILICIWDMHNVCNGDIIVCTPEVAWRVSIRTGLAPLLAAVCQATHFASAVSILSSTSTNISFYSKCHVTSNKANSKLECAEDKFQTRGWVQGCEK
jgi:hypothetical protein